MEISVITPDEEVKNIEGTVEAEMKKEEQVAPEKSNKPDTVPLAVYLDLKEDLKALKQEIKESKGSDKSKVENKGMSEIAKKYPDVNEDFINDILSSATEKATREIEAKYSPIIEKQEKAEKQAIFDRAFDNLFDKAISDNPDLPKTIDKELVKELALTPKYRNVPLSDVLIKMYGNVTVSKSSSENDMRTSADRVSEVADFAKITPEQRSSIMEDPKARAKYFSWLDTQPGR
jgi:hypothetical protein